MFNMPGLVWKSVNGERRFVMRWKKRINGKLKITKEIYIGDIDRLADMIENPMKDMHVMSLDFGTSAFVRMVDRKIGLKHIVDSVMGHSGKGMSSGDYMLPFLTNRLSDQGSKSAIERFVRRMEKVILKAREIMNSGDSDAMDRARIYLESENLNETILLLSLETDQIRMDEHLSIMGRNAIFTNITDMDTAKIIDLYYRKRNRMKHCFRTINTMGIAFFVYHWTPQKIRVRMFFSLIAYLFLALIRIIIKTVKELYLTTVMEVISTIRIVYMTRGKSVSVRLSSGG